MEDHLKPHLPLLVACLALCASCATMANMPTAASAPAGLAEEAVPEGMGRIVFGRPEAFAGSEARFRFQIEGTTVCEIGNGSYATVLVQAGERKLVFQNIAMGGTLWSQAALVAVPDGGTLYYEYRPNAFSPDKMFVPSSSPTLDYAGLRRLENLAAAVGSTTAAVPAAATKPQTTPAASAKPPAPAPAAKLSFPKGKSVFSGNVIAVVIGNRDYERGTSRVTYALNDAASFREALERSFGVAAQDIWYGENLGLADMISIFGGVDGYRRSRLFRTASMRDEPTDLVVYYSGHGAPSTSGATKGKGYLVPVDADLLAISSTGYAIDALLDNVAAMKKEGVIGRTWLTFDACFSGQAGDGSLLVKNVSGLAIAPVAPKAALADSVIMFAASGEEFASWYPEKGHGLFTYFLLKGLSGEADSDGDRSVAIGEIDSYLRAQVPRFANGLNAQEQTPQVLSSGGMPGFLTIAK